LSTLEFYQGKGLLLDCSSDWEVIILSKQAIVFLLSHQNEFLKVVTHYP